MNYNHLVIVIGPSGSGKDSLIAGARAALSADPVFYFVSREITRPLAAGGEQHIAVSENDFMQRCANDSYAICWHAHETWYGIDRSIEQPIADGKVVVFNGSRAAIDAARKKFPGVSVIYVDASEEVLAERLAARGRESTAQVRERLARNRQLTAIPDGVIVLSNTASLDSSISQFIGILQSISAGDTDCITADEVIAS